MVILDGRALDGHYDRRDRVSEDISSEGGDMVAYSLGAVALGNRHCHSNSRKVRNTFRGLTETGVVQPIE